MAKLLKLRRGTTTQHSSFTGAEGEVTIDVDKDVPVVHDGSTAGGHPVAAEDLANVSSATIVGRLNAASIPPVNIASGALPSNVTVTTNNITDLTVATGDIADQAVTLAKLEHGTSSNDGKFLRANNNADPTFETINTDLVADTSPQLGGELMTNGNKITFGDSSGVGDDRLVFGAGSDLQIYHDGNNSHIAEVGTGALSIKGSQVSIDSDDGSEYQLKAIQNGAVELYHNGNKKFETSSTGASLTGDLAVSGNVSGTLANGVAATTQGASDNSTKVATTAYVTTAVNNLVDSAPGALNTLNELAAAMGDDANFSTTVTNSIATKFANGGGSTITGDFSIASGTTNKNITVDVSDKIKFDDNLKVTFGSSDDLEIVHNGSGSYLKETGNGNLELWSNTLVFRNAAGNEVMAAFLEDGTSKLYYDNTQTLETTSSGILVTGAVYSSTGVVGESSSNNIDFTTDNRMAIHINGSEEFRFESDGDFHADGDVIAFSTTISSDERLKENIEIVPDALDKVEALRGVTFDWKRDGKSSAGVIAQEVMGVLPEAVKEVQGLNDNESHLTVNYHALTSILIESIKELSARVKELEAK